jgi:hypothetical protein
MSVLFRGYFVEHSVDLQHRAVTPTPWLFKLQWRKQDQIDIILIKELNPRRRVYVDT